MTKISQVVFTGKSSSKYSFDVYPMNYEIPNTAGIYIFSKRVNNNGKFNHTPIYIGKAKSFETRFYDHHKTDCITKNEANCICLMAVKDESQRTTIEKDLLLAYPTKCNEVNNPITPR